MKLRCRLLAVAAAAVVLATSSIGTTTAEDPTADALVDVQALAATPSTTTKTTAPPPTKTSTTTAGDDDDGGDSPIPVVKSSAPTTTDTKAKPTKPKTDDDDAGSSATGSSSSSTSNDSRSPTTAKKTTKPAKGGDDADADADGGSVDYFDSELTYACACKDVRKVSVKGAADYCLAPSAVVGNKCGNVAVGEQGECPRAGAQPCQDTGHVLMNDSLCVMTAGTFKCVASRDDAKTYKMGKSRVGRTPVNLTHDDEVEEISAVESTWGGRTVLLCATTLLGLLAFS